MHTYSADPQSGAGNCICGMAERHRTHPHQFIEAAGIGGPGGNPNHICTCGLSADAGCHR